MSATKALPSRYVWLKAMTALEAALGEARAGSGSGAPPTFSAALARFKEAYNKPLTTVMYITGAAMVPSLNKQALEDKGALEKLVRGPAGGHVAPRRAAPRCVA